MFDIYLFIMTILIDWWFSKQKKIIKNVFKVTLTNVE